MNVTITGAKELAKMLNELPIKLERNIMRAALRAGAKVIADEAKQQVSVVSGELKRSIRTSSNSKKGVVEANAVVGRKKQGWYATFVEFGTAAHPITAGKNAKRLRFRLADGKWFTGVSVNHTGARAKPFMRPAFDIKGQEAVQTVTNRIRERLNNNLINQVASESGL
jgi:HK97 gp10 family phage protein